MQWLLEATLLSYWDYHQYEAHERVDIAHSLRFNGQRFTRYQSSLAKLSRELVGQGMDY